MNFNTYETGMKTKYRKKDLFAYLFALETSFPCPTKVNQLITQNKKCDQL